MPRRLGSIVRSRRKLGSWKLQEGSSIKKSVSFMNGDESDRGSTAGDDIGPISSHRSGDSESERVSTHESIRSDFSDKIRKSTQALELNLDDGERRNSSFGTEKPSTSEKLTKVVVEASKSSRRSTVKKALSSSTLAQLRLSDLKLHGREDDMAMLKDKLSNMDNVGGELVLVAGVSGIGKTALITRGLERPAKKKGIAFVRGKFDLNNNALPYSAFADALSGLAKHVMHQKNVEKIKAEIREALGEDDMAVISNAMQGCEDFFTLDYSHKSKSTRFNKTGGKEAVNRMQYAVRRLIKVFVPIWRRGW